MNKGIIIYLVAIFIVSYIVFLLVNKKYKFNKLFLALYSLLLTLFGALSTMILAYIEMGKFGGTSYFGAVFLLPVFLLMFSYLFKLKKTSYLFDLMSLMGSATLVIMKIRCFIEGCCAGRILFYFKDSSPFIFPSQIAEGVNGLIILAILLVLIFKNKYKGKLYFIFMLIYGITRFILSFFRYYKPVFLNLAMGHIWSICSIVIAAYVLYCYKELENKEKK